MPLRRFPIQGYFPLAFPVKASITRASGLDQLVAERKAGGYSIKNDRPAGSHEGPASRVSALEDVLEAFPEVSMRLCADPDALIE